MFNTSLCAICMQPLLRTVYVIGLWATYMHWKQTMQLLYGLSSDLLYSLVFAWSLTDMLQAVYLKSILVL